MFKGQHLENFHYLQKFINRDVHGLRYSMQTQRGFDAFYEELCKVESDRRMGVLSTLTDIYIVRDAVMNALIGDGAMKDEVTGIEVPDKLESLFRQLMDEVSKHIVGYSIDELGRVTFNRKFFAETVIELVQLVIDEKDPERLLIYNYQNGRWVDAIIPLRRLILEIAYSVGGQKSDCWGVNLENVIIEIIKRKTEELESANFNKNYFPFANVSLDYITGEIVSHSPFHYSTFGSPVNYKPDAKCPVFEQFLISLFESEETFDFVQEWFGYTLSGSHQANSFLLGVGAGSNGKSTLFDVLAQLVGIENVSSAPLSNFNSDFGLQPLIGKKLNLATESDVDAFKTGKLKALTAGENISINRKNKAEITTKLPTKLIFLMNELPLLSDDTFGFERRLLILPFSQTFVESQQDKNLPKKLSDELEGILNWSLVGLRRLIANNYTFTTSKPMQEAKELYLGVGDPVARFVEENVVAAPSNVMEGKEVINAYKLWMTENEYPFKGTESPRKFWGLFDEALNLKLISFTRAKSGGRAVVRDIALK